MPAVTIQQALKTATVQLANSDTAKLDAEVLLAHCLANTRTQLYTYPEKIVPENQLKQFENLVLQRSTGIPVAYLIGHCEFWSLDLSVTPDTLIPRPETEHLVEWVLNTLPADEPLIIADLGTGSGAIAIALAHERSHWTIHATDISTAALTVAKNNAAQHQLNNILFFEGHWCDALPEQQYHAIVSNPPYITDADTHLLTLKHEPLSALSSGPEGLNAIKEITATTLNKLAPHAYLAIEHGYHQATAVKDYFINNHFNNIEQHADLAKHLRFTTGRL